MKYGKAHTLRTQQAIAQYGKSARYPLCLAALNLWRLNVELSVLRKREVLAEEALNSAKEQKEQAKALIEQFRNERKEQEVNQACALWRKLDKLFLKAKTGFLATVKLRLALQEWRRLAVVRYEREHDSAVRTGDIKARRALPRVRKRWNDKKAFLGDSDRRTLEMLKMLRDEANKAAWLKGGAIAGYTEAARGGDLALSDEAWKGFLTAREIQSRLVDAPGDRHAKEVRRQVRKLGIPLAEDQRGRKPKPYLPKQEPKRPRGRPRTKVWLEFHENLDAVEAKQARKGKTPRARS